MLSTKPKNRFTKEKPFRFETSLRDFARPCFVAPLDERPEELRAGGAAGGSGGAADGDVGGLEEVR